MEPAPEELRAAAVGHIPSGLFIVCAPDTNQKGRWDGFLASWIQQVSFDPLLVSLCIQEGRPSAQQILEGHPFSINVLGDAHKNILKHFWSGYDPKKNPFEEIEYNTGAAGELFLNSCRSVIVCKKVSSSQPGDHHMVIAEVIKSFINDNSANSMIHTRHSGLKY